jgi:hypothetical protein
MKSDYYDIFHKTKIKIEYIASAKDRYINADDVALSVCKT